MGAVGVMINMINRSMLHGLEDRLALPRAGAGAVVPCSLGARSACPTERCPA
jgi:hypothetical protein